ncbi:hypothetical protein TcBrA4_0052420 [Trypanosoma cruzi]|nr:hypothetical protein TcBrA4_0052420 [Trypanosoma cruzi]
MLRSGFPAGKRAYFFFTFSVLLGSAALEKVLSPSSFAHEVGVLTTHVSNHGTAGLLAAGGVFTIFFNVVLSGTISLRSDAGGDGDSGTSAFGGSVYMPFELVR